MTGVLCVGRVDRVPSENLKHSNAFKFVVILQCSPLTELIADDYPIDYLTWFDLDFTIFRVKISGIYL